MSSDKAVYGVDQTAGGNSHLEQAETGLDTLSSGVSAGLMPPERCMFAREVLY
jgi:hypothetical protein